MVKSCEDNVTATLFNQDHNPSKIILESLEFCLNAVQGKFNVTCLNLADSFKTLTKP